MLKTSQTSSSNYQSGTGGRNNNQRRNNNNKQYHHHFSQQQSSLRDDGSSNHFYSSGGGVSQESSAACGSKSNRGTGGTHINSKVSAQSKSHHQNHHQQQQQLLQQGKIFVGGIPATTTKSKLMQYFGEYGEIDDCIIMVDRDHKPRGFGFVTFRDLISIEQVLADEGEHYIDGKLVECKKAVPKEASTSSTAQASASSSVAQKSSATSTLSASQVAAAKETTSSSITVYSGMTKAASESVMEKKQSTMQSIAAATASATTDKSISDTTDNKSGQQEDYIPSSKQALNDQQQHQEPAENGYIAAFMRSVLARNNNQENNSQSSTGTGEEYKSISPQKASLHKYQQNQQTNYEYQQQQQRTTVSQKQSQLQHRQYRGEDGDHDQEESEEEKDDQDQVELKRRATDSEDKKSLYSQGSPQPQDDDKSCQTKIAGSSQQKAAGGSDILEAEDSPSKLPQKQSNNATTHAQNLQWSLVLSQTRSEKAKKEKQDLLDSKVAEFADQLLIEQQENIPRGGTSRRESSTNISNWAQELGYLIDKDQKKAGKESSKEVSNSFQNNATMAQDDELAQEQQQSEKEHQVHCKNLVRQTKQEGGLQQRTSFDEADSGGKRTNRHYEKGAVERREDEKNQILSSDQFEPLDHSKDFSNSSQFNNSNDDRLSQKRGQNSKKDQPQENQYLMQDRQDEEKAMERKAIKFVDSLQHQLPQRAAQTSEQILKDQEELSTLQSIVAGNQSLCSSTGGDQIDAQLRKVFVGGLPHNLQLSCFKSYFANFGQIEDCVILQDKRTNKPRGFGFVTYRDIRSVNLVLKLKLKHVIQNKWVDVKSAVPIQQMKEVMLAQQSRAASQQQRNHNHNSIKQQQQQSQSVAQASRYANSGGSEPHYPSAPPQHFHPPPPQALYPGNNSSSEPSQSSPPDYMIYHPEIQQQHQHQQQPQQKQYHQQAPIYRGPSHPPPMPHQMHHSPQRYYAQSAATSGQTIGSPPQMHHVGYGQHPAQVSHAYPGGHLPHYQDRVSAGVQPPHAHTGPPQAFFPDHKPPVPDADQLFQQQYHQYMQAAANQWYYQQQHFKHYNQQQQQQLVAGGVQATQQQIRAAARPTYNDNHETSYRKAAKTANVESSNKNYEFYQRQSQHQYDKPHSDAESPTSANSSNLQSDNFNEKMTQNQLKNSEKQAAETDMQENEGKKVRPSRLPPPMPPPPEMFHEPSLLESSGYHPPNQYFVYGTTSMSNPYSIVTDPQQQDFQDSNYKMTHKQIARQQQQVKMSPDGSTISASLHKTEIENHLQSLIDDYQPGHSMASFEKQSHSNDKAAYHHLEDHMNPFHAQQQYQIRGTGTPIHQHLATSPFFYQQHPQHHFYPHHAMPPIPPPPHYHFHHHVSSNGAYVGGPGGFNGHRAASSEMSFPSSQMGQTTAGSEGQKSPTTAPSDKPTSQYVDKTCNSESASLPHQEEKQ